MVAHHADVAGDDRRALDYHRRAAEAAARVYSVEEAIEHYDGVLAAAGRLGLGDAQGEVGAATFARATLLFSVGELEVRAATSRRRSPRLARPATRSSRSTRHWGWSATCARATSPRPPS